MTKTRKKSDMVFMVTRRDTFTGMSIRALTHEAAAAKAMRYASMKGAAEVEVRRFCGPAGSSSPVMVQVNS